MVQAINLDMDEMDEILDALPEELRKKISAQIKPFSFIASIQEFLEKYEENDIRDHIVAIIVSNIILKSYRFSTALIKERKAEGNGGITTIEMGKILIKILNDEANNLQLAFDKHNENCKHGEDCGVKH